MSSTSISTSRLTARSDRPASPAPIPAGPGKEARRLAAVILEVLGGARTPTQAAEVLGLSLIRYYQLETRAVHGLVAACEPKPRGRVVSPQTKVVALEKEQQRLRRELARQQALVRLSQRALGLPPPPAAAAKPAGKGRKPRRPMARALKMAEQLQADDNENAEGSSPCCASAEAK
jgi:hypothetical protein